MQSMMDRLKELGIRLHAIYLSIEDLDDQYEILRLEHMLIVARHWLYDKKYELFSQLIKVFVKDTKKIANQLRRLYGESLRGKMRRIAEAADSLILSEKEYKKLKAVPAGQQGLEPYSIYASNHAYFYSEFSNIHCYVDDIVNFTDIKIRARLPYILLELYEYALLLDNQIIDGMMNPDWYLSQDIVRSLNEVGDILRSLLDNMVDCGYKCKVYSALLMILELGYKLGNYYISEE